MIKKYILIIFFLFSLNTNFYIFSQEIISPYFAINETFGLSQTPERGRYRIIAFIPRYYLLYIENREELIEISDTKYLRATTQDGVKIFINESDVSKKTFEKIIGKHQYIFNAPYEIFKDSECDEEAGETWSVGPGEAFYTDSTPSDMIVKLIGKRLPDIHIEGYVRKTRLRRLEKIGVITRTDRHHPKYIIEQKEVETLGTKCGEVVESGKTFALRDDGSLEKLILEKFGFGEVVGGDQLKEVRYTRFLGEKGKKISFYIYDVFEPVADKKSNYIAGVVYSCDTSAIGKTPIRIDNVEIYGPNGEKWTLAFADFKSPDELIELINSPYLLSVNFYSHYFNLIERLSDKFGDRTLAGYFLCEFNRSLPSKHRRKPIAGSYSYRKE